MKKIGGDSGQTLIFVALSMTVLLGFVGFATDVGVLLHEKRAAQTAADSAALAAAMAMLENKGGTTAQAQQAATTAGQADAASNGFTDGSNGATVTINTPITDDVNPSFNGSTDYVEAIVSQSTPTFLMRMFGHSNMTVSARAVATDTLTSNGCVYVPDPTKYDPAADLGGNSLIMSPNCSDYVDGNLDMSGSSLIVAGYTGVSGNIQFTGNKASISGTYGTSAPTSDPLSYLSQLPGNGPTVNSDGVTCSPPANNGSFDHCYLNQPLTANMPSGIYMYTQTPTFSGTTISVVNNAPITIFLSGTVGFSINKNLSVDLNSPRTGTYQGILIDAPTDVATDNSCTHGSMPNVTPGTLLFDFGSSSLTWNGAVYAPQAHMFLQDQGSAVSMNSDLIVGTLCQQSADVTINGQSDNSPIKRVGLIE